MQQASIKCTAVCWSVYRYSRLHRRGSCFDLVSKLTVHSRVTYSSVPLLTRTQVWVAQSMTCSTAFWPPANSSGAPLSARMDQSTTKNSSSGCVCCVFYNCVLCVAGHQGVGAAARADGPVHDKELLIRLCMCVRALCGFLLLFVHTQTRSTSSRPRPCSAAGHVKLAAREPSHSCMPHSNAKHATSSRPRLCSTAARQPCHKGTCTAPSQPAAPCCVTFKRYKNTQLTSASV